MPWAVLLHADFVDEVRALPLEAQDEMAAMVRLLQQFGPQLGHPRCDTLKGSKHANMKELRFDAADGVWRSPSIRPGEPCCWSAATNRGPAKRSSTRP